MPLWCSGGTRLCCARRTREEQERKKAQADGTPNSNHGIHSEVKYGSVLKYLLFEKLFENKNIIQIECQVKKGFEWIRDWHIRWGHEQINFNYKLNCYNLVLKKEVWNNKKIKIYEKGFKKN